MRAESQRLGGLSTLSVSSAGATSSIRRPSWISLMTLHALPYRLIVAPTDGIGPFVPTISKPPPGYRISYPSLCAGMKAGLPTLQRAKPTKDERPPTRPPRKLPSSSPCPCPGCASRHAPGRFRTFGLAGMSASSRSTSRRARKVQTTRSHSAQMSGPQEEKVSR